MQNSILKKNIFLLGNFTNLNNANLKSSFRTAIWKFTKCMFLQIISNEGHNTSRMFFILSNKCHYLYVYSNEKETLDFMINSHTNNINMHTQFKKRENNQY